METGHGVRLEHVIHCCLNFTLILEFLSNFFILVKLLSATIIIQYICHNDYI